MGTGPNAKLFIYYFGDKEIEFSGLADSHIYLYAPNATLSFDGGGSGSFIGSIIVKTFNGPSSTVEIHQDPTLTMEDLLFEPGYVVGYKRHAWRDDMVIE